MLKHGEVNPLNVHGLREISWCPPHFTKVNFQSYITEKVLKDWLYENLSGRFYVGVVDVSKSPNGSTRNQLVAFEIPGEASYFSLFLTQINQPGTFW